MIEERVSPDFVLHPRLNYIDDVLLYQYQRWNEFQDLINEIQQEFSEEAKVSLYFKCHEINELAIKVQDMKVKILSILLEINKECLKEIPTNVLMLAPKTKQGERNV